jgi:hypothetical protein
LCLWQRIAILFLDSQNLVRRHLIPGDGGAFTEERWQTTLKEYRPHREWSDTLAAQFTTRLPDELRPAQEYDTLTELIHQVGWPGLMADDPNEPHRVLASLNLPLYLTTNKSVWDLHQTVVK